MEAGAPTRLTTSIHPSNSSVAITQPFPALPGLCWGHQVLPTAKANSPLLTAPSCLWCLWHFPLQHFQPPVAPQPPRLRHSRGRANSNTRRLRRGRACPGASLAQQHPRPRGVLQHPTQGKPTSSPPTAPAQEMQSAHQLPRTGGPTPQWHSCEKHNSRASSKLTDSTAPGIPHRLNSTRDPSDQASPSVCFTYSSKCQKLKKGKARGLLALCFMWLQHDQLRGSSFLCPGR